LANKFPSLTSLKCGISFNHPIAPNSLPSSLTSLEFGELFNLPLDENVWLPPSLLTLRFGYCFNQPVEPGTLPSSLTELEFGDMFNQVIEPLTLPQSLLTLKFSFHFNQPIKSDTLPVSLTNLVFGDMFSQPLDGLLPLSLKSLAIGQNYLPDFTLKEHQSITELNISSFLLRPMHIDDIPSSVHTLSISPMIWLEENMEHLPIPRSVTDLYLGVYFNLPIGSFFGINLKNSSITILNLGSLFNQVIEPGVLPSTLKHLDCGHSFNQKLLPNSLPDSITELRMGPVFVQPLVNLPNGLISLETPSISSLKKDNLPKSLGGIVIFASHVVKMRSDAGFDMTIDGQPITFPSLDIHLNWITIGFHLPNDNTPSSKKKIIKHLFSTYPNVIDFNIIFTRLDHRSQSITVRNISFTDQLHQGVQSSVHSMCRVSPDNLLLMDHQVQQTIKFKSIDLTTVPTMVATSTSIIDRQWSWMELATTAIVSLLPALYLG
ncbi:hypothetical protein SAMD00019534_030020, partial [Acytostelium subglobosum LB1]|uniref:hypothetical protein n=1 Tax=Acytostelium subglobosum LB1 TaxID=1410327 RepID=UPI000644B685